MPSRNHVGADNALGQCLLRKFIGNDSRGFFEMGIAKSRFVWRQTAIGLVVILNSSFASTAIAAPAYFGYYYGDSEAYGHYMDKVVIPSDGTRLQDFTNLILIDIGTSYGQHDPRRAIIDAANLGYKILLYGASGFDKDMPGTWQSGFAEIDSVVSGYESFVYAVDLVDEPDGRGWSRGQIESLVSQAKTYFHSSMPMTVNLDIPALQPPPRNLDVYMFDYYVNGSLTHTTKAQYDSTMNGIIGAIRAAAPGKPMLILGSSFSDSTTSPYLGWYLPTAEQTQWYLDTARNTPEVNGLMWFMLGNPSPPVSYGAINYPALLSQHKQMGLTIVPHPTDQKVDERFSYANQAALQSVYQGVVPTLTAAIEHGNNGGKSVAFGGGAEMALRQISAQNRPGSVDAFLLDYTLSPNDYFGLRAVSSDGHSIAVYARGSHANYFVTDEANGISGFETAILSLAHWQKVEFAFDGAGVEVLIDSLPVYTSATGWEGGFSAIGFYDPWGSFGIGYVDDIRAFQSVPGDLDGDGDVDLGDYGVLTSHWLQEVVVNTTGDLDGNGLIDIRDFGAFKRDYNAFNGNTSGLEAPEPGTLTLLVLALTALSIFCQHRRQTN